MFQCSDTVKKKQDKLFKYYSVNDSDITYKIPYKRCSQFCKQQIRKSLQCKVTWNEYSVRTSPQSSALVVHTDNIAYTGTSLVNS